MSPRLKIVLPIAVLILVVGFIAVSKLGMNKTSETANQPAGNPTPTSIPLGVTVPQPQPAPAPVVPPTDTTITSLSADANGDAALFKAEQGAATAVTSDSQSINAVSQTYDETKF